MHAKGVDRCMPVRWAAVCAWGIDSNEARLVCGNHNSHNMVASYKVHILSILPNVLAGKQEELGRDEENRTIDPVGN